MHSIHSSTPDKALKIKSLLQSYYVEQQENEKLNGTETLESQRSGPPSRTGPPSIENDTSKSLQTSHRYHDMYAQKYVSELQSTEKYEDTGKNMKNKDGVASIGDGVEDSNTLQFANRSNSGANYLGFQDKLKYLDDPYFDAEKTSNQMIREERLSSLVEHHGRLAAEAATIDSDMQTVVYENYSKFVKAADIIYDMASDMEGLDNQLRKLDTLISKVVEHSESVNGRLEERQNAIDELSESRELLEQLQQVLGVPEVLRVALEREALDIVAETYSSVAPVLKSLGNRKALESAAASVEEYRKRTVDILKNKLSRDPNTAGDVVPLLAKLDEASDSLFPEYMAGEMARLASVLNKTEREFSDISSSSNIENTVSFVDNFVSGFVSELNTVIKTSSSLFGESCRPKLLTEVRTIYYNFSEIMKKITAQIIATEVLKCLSLNSTLLEDSEKEDRLLSQEDREEIPEDGWGFELVRSMLTNLHRNVVNLGESVSEIVINDKIADITSHIAKCHITSSLHGVQARILVDIQVMLQTLECHGDPCGLPLPSLLREKIHDIISSVRRTLRIGLAVVSHWKTCEWITDDWHDIFVSIVQSQVADLLHGLADYLPSLTVMDEGLQDSSVASRQNESSNLALQSLVLSSCYPSLKSWKYRNPSISNNPGNALLVSILCSMVECQLGCDISYWLEQNNRANASSILSAREEFRRVASNLFERFTLKMATSLENNLRAFLEGFDWEVKALPKFPNSIYVNILDDLKRLKSTLVAIESVLVASPLGGTNSGMHIDESVEGSKTNRGVQDQERPSPLMDNTAQKSVSRINNELPEDSSWNMKECSLPWSSSDECLANIASLVLKSQIAFIKTKLLSRAAFQQVQVDCHYLQVSLHKIINESTSKLAVSGHIDETLVAAAERCAEGPTLLEPNVLDRLIKK